MLSNPHTLVRYISYVSRPNTRLNIYQIHTDLKVRQIHQLRIKNSCLPADNGTNTCTDEQAYTDMKTKLVCMRDNDAREKNTFN